MSNRSVKYLNREFRGRKWYKVKRNLVFGEEDGCIEKERDLKCVRVCESERERERERERGIEWLNIEIDVIEGVRESVEGRKKD